MKTLERPELFGNIPESMKKLYIVRREDAFKIGFPQSAIMEAGSIWMRVALTDSERASYPYSISDY